MGDLSRWTDEHRRANWCNTLFGFKHRMQRPRRRSASSLDELPNDFEPRLRYRIAYGEAARLREIARFNHVSGKDFAAGIGGDTELTQAEVTRWVFPGIDPELIKMAVEDVMEKRRPRW